jgi:preprotein translocase subunit SecE
MVMAIEQSRAKGGGGAGSAEQSTERARNFLMETWSELKKTTWPTKQEATRLTSVVIGVIVVLGIYMGLLDSILSFLVNRFGLIK